MTFSISRLGSIINSLTVSEERQAERTLLNLTKDLNSEQLENFLTRHGVPHTEYELLLVKYSRLLEGLKKLEEKI